MAGVIPCEIETRPVEEQKEPTTTCTPASKKGIVGAISSLHGLRQSHFINARRAERGNLWHYHMWIQFHALTSVKVAYT